jgi:hypothetical protein
MEMKEFVFNGYGNEAYRELYGAGRPVANPLRHNSAISTSSVDLHIPLQSPETPAKHRLAESSCPEDRCDQECGVVAP